jgi:hypothetical protein
MWIHNSNRTTKEATTVDKAACSNSSNIRITTMCNEVEIITTEVVEVVDVVVAEVATNREEETICNRTPMLNSINNNNKISQVLVDTLPNRTLLTILNSRFHNNNNK